MKLIIVAYALVAVAVAAPASQQSQVPQIIRSELKKNPDGSYSSIVETDDGYKREEEGQLREVQNEKGELVKVIVVSGSYIYTDPEGYPQVITYTADQDGFHAEGPSIPKGPEPNRR